VTGSGCITSASVGQRSTQLPQPVQASRITLWICFAAPRIASVGQTLMQRQQPMQVSSATMAICGPRSTTAARSMLMPSFAASACASALPPGGQSGHRRAAAGDRRRRRRTAGETALAAVGSRHQGGDFIDHRVAFDLEFLRREAERRGRAASRARSG
jgi:hypothetical protein